MGSISSSLGVRLLIDYLDYSYIFAEIERLKMTQLIRAKCLKPILSRLGNLLLRP